VEKAASLLKEGRTMNAAEGTIPGAHLVKQCAPIFGGSSRSRLPRIVDLCCSIRRGLHFRDALFFRQLHLAILLARDFSVTRRTVGLVISQYGGRPGLCFHQRCWSLLGPWRLSAHLLLLSRCLLQSRFGPIPLHAPWWNRAKTYLGERSFPLIMQNAHRYFLYLALIFLVILTIDVWKALWFVDATNGKVRWIGVVHRAHINVVALVAIPLAVTPAAFGRGFLDQFSKSQSCYRAYACVSLLQSAATCSGHGSVYLGRLRGSLRAIVLDGHLA
jgi:hypothetical protein